IRRCAETSSTGTVTRPKVIVPDQIGRPALRGASSASRSGRARRFALGNFLLLAALRLRLVRCSRLLGAREALAQSSGEIGRTPRPRLFADHELLALPLSL